ncbi:short-chain fatty acid transporter [Schnuerera sp. xch1]|uniref:short-chain fatty acid transporter n=1 Tax=Schnuerera sp. xch1 TaxID=2874283 RepID=UPI001CBC8176|nr:short-chain fatty acid transporter [Schnuerera sp. xch1]MBZ2174927.1 short-chain fatty acid transporter [Schnuerera sp. xch1]
MFKKFTNGCVELVQKYLPDPFLFAIVLTILVFILGITATGQGPIKMVAHWGNGVWSLLAFSMQMTLVLVTGHTMASAPVMRKGLTELASIPKTPTQAIFAVSLISAIACWINWGFGLVIGALYARELAKQIKKVDYRLLIAAAYSGFLVWHAGISGSIPLILATPGEALSEATLGAVVEAIPTTQTIFSLFNLIISAAIIIALSLINSAMHPKEEDVYEIDPKLLEDPEQEVIVTKVVMTSAEKMENSPVLSMITGILGIAYIIYHFSTNGFDLNLNIVNLIFLIVGIILHGTPRRYLNALQEAVKGAGGIILQFPFYAGIMGMMTGKSELGVSLAGQMSHMFVSISTQATYPLFTFLSAGLVNFFVPSGGGQWAVQAPIMMPAGLQLGVDSAVTGMAIAWGDAWTNMIQPFWALPALGIAGLGARDIMGYCLVDLLISGVIICAGFLILV